MADDKPEPIPRKSPKKGSGPSMREQIAARRRAEQAAGAASEPAAAAAPAAKPAARSAPKSRAASSKAAKGERPARPTRSGAARSGATASRRSRDGAEGGARRSRREKPEKKSSPMLLIAGVVVILGGAGAYFGGLFGGDPTEETSSEGTDAVTASGDQEDAGDTSESAATDDASAEAAAADEAATPEGEATSEAPSTEPAVKPKPRKKTGKLTDNSTDELKAMFAALEPFTRPQEISEAEWNELGQKANLLFVDAGRKSAAAERELSIDGKKEIYPLVINKYIAMDFESEEQVLGGKSAARVLTAVRGSKNDRFDIGWRTAGESEDGTFGEKELRQDLMIVINLHKSWSKVVADPAHWERIYIGEMYKEAEEIMQESAESKLDDLDDLDLDDLDLDDIDG